MRKTDLFNKIQITYIPDTVHEPSHRTIAKSPQGRIQLNGALRIDVELSTDLSYDVAMASSLDAELHDPLNADIEWLPESRTISRHKTDDDCWVVSLHPGEEFLGFMDRPTINLP